MSLETNLQALAELCEASAHQNLTAIIALGPRPTDAAAAGAWDETQGRLKGRMDRLTALSVSLAGEAVVQALAAAGQDLSAITAVTAKARKRIADIKKISAVLSAVGAVLDLGLAVVTLAGAPTADGLEDVVRKAKALGEAIDAVDAAG